MIGLYIHIPFCKRKCEYCDFLSFDNRCSDIDRYLTALISEMEKYKGTEVDTVFVGGGTPSILSSGEITRLCDAINSNFTLADKCEFTMEINPGTVDNDKILSILKGGVNRASVGVQSFNNDELKAVGRIHDSDTAYNTVLSLYNNGFTNISIDLMASLPMQTEESFKHTLDTVVKLPIKHISVYSLIVEEGTPLCERYKLGEYKEIDEERDRFLYKYTNDFLGSNGFERYEISNYALSGFCSKHNKKYWNCEEYIGIGLGASSYRDAKRYKNVDDMESYLQGITIDEDSVEEMTREDMMGEFMMLGLRKREGVSRSEFNSRFGIDMQMQYGDTIDKFKKAGFLETVGENVRLTESGIDISNSVMCEFLL